MKFSGEESFLNFFSDIASIPHGSGNLNGIVRYLQQFAKKRNLFYLKDATNNVLIKKTGTAGRQKEKPIVLQAHLDMVCEKTSDSDHDFIKDGLSLIREGDILRADKTTLGGDDGIGVSLILAILDSKDIRHPPLECLFTADEETGMDGASSFDYSLLSSNLLINLDGGASGRVTTGCAGGIRVCYEFRAEQTENAFSVLSLSLNGLKGGHSGSQINKGRGNAIQLMSDLLLSVYDVEPFQLVEINGGDKMNAIPRDCSAKIAVRNKKYYTELIRSAFSSIKKDVVKEDKAIKLTIANGEKTPAAFLHKDTRKLLTLLSAIRSGVIAMSEDYKDLPETSGNLAKVRTEDDLIKIGYSLRSLKDSKLKNEVLRQKMIAKTFDCSFSTNSPYPAWEYSKDSLLQTMFARSYQAVTGKEVRFCVVHAGLECGIISKKIKDLDAICVGPDLFDIHTPNERLSIGESVKMLRVLKHFLNEKFE